MVFPPSVIWRSSAMERYRTPPSVVRDGRIDVDSVAWWILTTRGVRAHPLRRSSSGRGRRETSVAVSVRAVCAGWRVAALLIAVVVAVVAHRIAASRLHRRVHGSSGLWILRAAIASGRDAVLRSTGAVVIHHPRLPTPVLGRNVSEKVIAAGEQGKNNQGDEERYRVMGGRP